MPSKKHRDKMRAKRVEYFFDERVKLMLRDVSKEWGIPQSQILQFFLLTGLQDVNKAKTLMAKYLEPSEAPMWQYNINLDRLMKDLGME